MTGVCWRAWPCVGLEVDAADRGKTGPGEVFVRREPVADGALRDSEREWF